MLGLSERAAAISAVVALTGWLVGVVDLDLFSPDGAADLETDLYAAALLVAAYAVMSYVGKLFVARGFHRDVAGWVLASSVS